MELFYLLDNLRQVTVPVKGIGGNVFICFRKVSLQAEASASSGYARLAVDNNVWPGWLRWDNSQDWLPVGLRQPESGIAQAGHTLPAEAALVLGGQNHTSAGILQRPSA